MLKKLIIAVFILLPYICAAQDPSNPSIPMKKNLIWYESSYGLNTGEQKQDAFKGAVAWFNDRFANTGGNLTIADAENGEIAGTGQFKVRTSQTGNYYWLRFKVQISLSDTGYTFKAYNVYEKPVEKGISNEFSKLEYRWWDYRQGHPWSVEDTVLFRRMDSTMNLMMVTLQNKIGKH